MPLSPALIKDSLRLLLVGRVRSLLVAQHVDRKGRRNESVSFLFYGLSGDY
jgi:hypothetical protein